MTKKTQILLALALAILAGASAGCDSNSGSNGGDGTEPPFDTAHGDTSTSEETLDTVPDTTNDRDTENTDTDPLSTGTSADTGTGNKDTGNGDTGEKDTGTGTGNKDTGTGTGIDTDDIDTNVSIDCDVPEGYLDPPANDNGVVPSSWITFQFEGILNSNYDTDPEPGTGHINLVLRGSSLDLNEELTAYFSYQSSLAYVQGQSKPDADGNFYYVQIKITVDDLMYMDENGIKTANITESYSGTAIRLYSARVDDSGTIIKACQDARTQYEYDITNEKNRYPTEYYICNTSINFIANVGESFPIAGRARLFDDTSALAESEGMRCSCENGAGGWRNCDEGIPSAYGLMRFGFKTGLADNAYWTKYIYDDAKLWNLGRLNEEYVLAHPEGYWQEGIGFINGGLNIGPYVPPFGGTEEWLFGFGVQVPTGAVTNGLAGHRSDIGKVVLYEQSFNARDGNPEGVGFWVNTFIPDSLQTGDSVAFGPGEDQGQMFVYDDSDPYRCIIAAACGGEPVEVVRAENLSAAEGGKLELRSTPTEVNGHDTRYSVELYHPDELPASCDWNTYLEEAGQPKGVAVCPKW